MSINKQSILIVCEKNHPHYQKLNEHFCVRNMDEAIASYETYDFVFDFTILRTDKKILFLKELTRTTRAKILSDLTLTFQEKVFQACPQIAASVSSFFYSPTNTIEYFLNPNELNPENKKIIIELINHITRTISINASESKILEITFTMPRVVAQIINEAYFALEENLASKNDIDNSMLFGVNYPEGPIAWGQKTGLSHIVSLLEEMHQATLDARYRPSLKLKKECLCQN